MINAYHSLVTYSDNDWQEYLERLCLIDIFKDLLNEYPDKDNLRCAVRYIMYAYSVESEMVILNKEWHKNKKDIFEAAQVMPRKGLYEDLVLLKSNAVVETIHRWLNFQDNDTFTQISVLKDLRVEMQLTCLTGIKKPSGEIDYDQKFKNAEYGVELKKMIRDLESELIQNSLKLKEAIREIRTARNKNTIGVEMFAK